MTKEIGIWEVAVLALLREAPMHPYQMQSLLRERHKDEILALKRGSLYHAVGRLVKAGFIEAAATDRDGRRPERTIYRITPSGRKELFASLRRIVAVPRRESSEFMAAMSFLIHLKPADASLRLRERCQRLEAETVQLRSNLKMISGRVSRIHLIESEYLLAMLRADLEWSLRLARELDEGKLNWDVDQIFTAVRASREAAGQPKE